MPLTLVLDKSVAFTNFQKEFFLEKNKIDPANTKKVDRITEAGGATLFGDSPASLMVVSSSDDVQQLITDLNSLEKSGVLQEKIKSGIFIQGDVPRTGTRKLEKLVSELGGEVIVMTSRKGEPTLTEQLLMPLKLNKTAKEFLVAYVGDDYEAVIPLVKTIGALPPAKQQEIDEEDLYVRLPQSPGAVPPWNLEAPLLKGNLSEVIDVFRRVSKHSHFLVVLAVLRNKFTGAYKVSALLDANPKGADSEIASQADVSPKMMWLMKRYWRDYGTAKLEKAVSIIAKTEAEVKGASASPPMVNMELMLVRLSSVLAK